MRIKFRTRYVAGTSLRLIIASGLLLLALLLSIATAISVPGSWTKYVGNPVLNTDASGT